MANATDTGTLNDNLSVTSTTLPLAAVMKYVSPENIPASEDLLSGEALEEQISALNEVPPSLIVVGDIMLGGRAKNALAEHGPNYPFDAVLPLLRRAPIVLGNLEGPFAQKARRQRRN